MSDEPQPTPLKVISFNAAKREREDREAKAADQRKVAARDRQASFMPEIRKLAEHFDLKVTAGGRVTEGIHTCDVCAGVYEVHEAFAGLDLCEQHAEQSALEVAKRVLRNVIPPEFADARPRHLTGDLTKWTGLDHMGLYLHGPVGTGKSYAAAALLMRAFMKRYRASSGHFPRPCWINMPTAILDTLSALSKKRDPSKLWDDAQTATLLVIDDIGIEAPRDWVRTRVYALIEHRLQQRLPTIITSNKDLDELSDHMDLPQVASRLAQCTYQIAFDGLPDRRTRNTPKL